MLVILYTDEYAKIIVVSLGKMEVKKPCYQILLPLTQQVYPSSDLTSRVT